MFCITKLFRLWVEHLYVDCKSLTNEHDLLKKIQEAKQPLNQLETLDGPSL